MAEAQAREQVCYGCGLVDLRALLKDDVAKVHNLLCVATGSILHSHNIWQQGMHAVDLQPSAAAMWHSG